MLLAAVAKGDAEVLVEFVGAAGAGKTHLAERLLGELRNRGLAANNVEETVTTRRRKRQLSLLPKAAWIALGNRPSSPANWLYDTKRILRYQRRLKRCRESNAFHIMSEGLFHMLRGVARRSRRQSMADLARHLLHYFPPPGLVVVLDADADTIERQRTERGRSGDHFSRQSIDDDVAMTSKIIDTIGSLKVSGMLELNAMIIQIKPNSTADAVSAIADELERIVHG